MASYLAAIIADRANVTVPMACLLLGRPDLSNEVCNVYNTAALKKLFENRDADIRIPFPEVIENALWKVRSFGPATLMETLGSVGPALADVGFEGAEDLDLVGERTGAAKRKDNGCL